MGRTVEIDGCEVEVIDLPNGVALPDGSLDYVIKVEGEISGPASDKKDPARDINEEETDNPVSPRPKSDTEVLGY